MKLGDTITLAGTEWTVRPFTAAEHQRFEELAAEQDLTGKAAALEALRNARAGTMRETLLRSDEKHHRAKLAEFLDGDDLKPDLSDTDRLTAYQLALQLDLVTEKLDSIKRESLEDAYVAEEELAQAREGVMTTFMHGITGAKQPLEEFQAALTNEEVVALDELIVLGKLRAGLSARNRRETVAIEKLMRELTSRETGKDSESKQPPAVARRKPGRTGRSKKSSSASKVGNSGRSKPPAQP